MTEQQELLVTDNLRLVYYLVNRLGKSAAVLQNVEELTSEGMVGLVKAAKAFDAGKGYKFATFASRCITNEILMFLRRSKKHSGNVSLSSAVGWDRNGHELLLEEILADPHERFKAVEDADIIRRLAGRLKPKEAEVLRGLAHEKKQREIGVEMNLTQSYVSRLVGKIREKHKELTAYG